MATLRKRGTKWQVQVRRKGQPSLTQSFHLKQDAEAWARQVELQADRNELPQDRQILETITLGELVERYRDTVCIKKRGYAVEKSSLNFFLRHSLCSRRLSELSGADFAAYRDEKTQGDQTLITEAPAVPSSRLCITNSKELSSCII